MAAEIVLGAAVGVVFEELKKLVLGTIRTVVGFESTLEKISGTLLRIDPLIQEIVKSDQELGGSLRNLNSHYINLFTRGKVLISLCSRVTHLQVIHRYVYAKKLKKFQADLTSTFLHDVPAHQLAVTSRQLVATSEMLHILKELRDSTQKDITGVCAAPDPPQYVVGFNTPLEELKVIFLDDGTHGSPEMVVLSAMPGSGKTTLAQMLCHDEAIRGKYANIFFVPVSKTASISLIVDRIFRHGGFRAPRVANDADAVFQLGVYFKSLGADSSILVVLDDVWSPGLESFVGKFMIQGLPRYRVLVTTRFEPPAFKSRTYRLNPLKFQDAKELLSHSAELSEEGDGNSRVPESLVNDVVELCKGSPLALEMVGISLRNQPFWMWMEILDRSSKRRSNVLNVNRDLGQLTTELEALDHETTLAIANKCSFDLSQRGLPDLNVKESASTSQRHGDDDDLATN